MKVNFAFHLEIKVCSLEEDWRDTESKLLEVQCEVFKVSDDLGCRDVCWCWSFLVIFLCHFGGKAMAQIFILAINLMNSMTFCGISWSKKYKYLLNIINTSKVG